MCNCNQRTQYFTLVMRMIFSWDIWMVFNWDKFKDVLKAARWMQATKWDLAVLMRWLMLLVDVGSLTAFEPKGDLNGISQWWKRWKRSFASYLTGKGVTDDKQKRALLLHAANLFYNGQRRRDFLFHHHDEGAWWLLCSKVNCTIWKALFQADCTS